NTGNKLVGYLSASAYEFGQYSSYFSTVVRNNISCIGSKITGSENNIITVFIYDVSVGSSSNYITFIIISLSHFSKLYTIHLNNFVDVFIGIRLRNCYFMYQLVIGFVFAGFENNIR